MSLIGTRTRCAAALMLPAILALGLTGCSDKDRPLFEEVALAAGVDIVLTCGEAGAKQTILEVNGNGVALADLDQDGDLDIVLVDGSTRARLVAGDSVHHHVLRNVGVVDGVPRFEAVGPGTGLEQTGWPTGIAVGDVDRDGLPDLLIGGLGEDALFLNRTVPGGMIRFEKRALPGRRSARDWTTSIALADADADGHLDAYIARYLEIDPTDPPIGHVGDIPCRYHGIDVMCGPHGLPPQPDVLLMGTDDDAFFRDASVASGVRAVPPAFGLGVLFMDLDLDGWPDLYIANDSVPNTLLRNRGDGRFEDVSRLSGAANDLSGRPQAGMGVDAGDVDRDGDLDLVVTNFSDESNALYRNDGGLLFRDVSAAMALAAPSRDKLGWGVHLADFDSDGRLDLYVSNGHVYPQADDPRGAGGYAQKQQLFMGQPDGKFGPDVFADERLWRGRASVRGDLDGDGDLDLLTLTLNGSPRLYLNRTDDPARQMLVTLADEHGPVPGASLSLQTATGPHIGQVMAGSSFQACSDPRLHIGGGATVTAARVIWPGGVVEELDPAAMMSGHHVVVRRGHGIVRTLPLGTP
jgi:hypothetical protein